MRTYLENFITSSHLHGALHQIERFEVWRASAPIKCQIELKLAKSMYEML
jgi:hypothetical protein